MPGLDSGRVRCASRTRARFHPTRYLAGLGAGDLGGTAGGFFADTAYVDHREDDGGVTARDRRRARAVRARRRCSPTNSPVNTKVALHTKQVPMRTYAIARAGADAARCPTCWCGTRSRRTTTCGIQELSEGEDWLIVGGEDHRSGEASDMDRRIGALAEWTRRRYPWFGDGRVQLVGAGARDDRLHAVLGPGARAARRIYVHTGDSGQGITNGVAGALTIVPLILGEDSRFAEVLDPARKPASPCRRSRSSPAAVVGAVKNLAEHVVLERSPATRPAGRGSLMALAPGPTGSDPARGHGQDRRVPHGRRAG